MGAKVPGIGRLMAQCFLTNEGSLGVRVPGMGCDPTSMGAEVPGMGCVGAEANRHTGQGTG